MQQRFVQLGLANAISGSSSSYCLLSLYCTSFDAPWLLLSVFLRVRSSLRLELLHQLRRIRALHLKHYLSG